MATLIPFLWQAAVGTRAGREGYELNYSNRKEKVVSSNIDGGPRLGSQVMISVFEGKILKYG